jgi:hypothetical protein
MSSAEICPERTTWCMDQQKWAGITCACALGGVQICTLAPGEFVRRCCVVITTAKHCLHTTCRRTCPTCQKPQRLRQSLFRAAQAMLYHLLRLRTKEIGPDCMSSSAAGATNQGALPLMPSSTDVQNCTRKPAGAVAQGSGAKQHPT